MSLTNTDFQIKPSSDLKAGYVLTSLNSATNLYSGDIQFIESIEEVKEAVKELEKHTTLAVDCEGVRLGKGGKLTLVQIGAKDDTIYIFDILKLKNDGFDLGLKRILESESITKVMFDCRGDSDSLWDEFQIRITNVTDMQVFEFICRPIAGKALRGPTKPAHHRRPMIRGMNDTVKNYVSFAKMREKGINNFDSIKEKGGSLMNMERTIWRYRPLSEGLLKYAALDIEMIWIISEALPKFVPLTGINLEKVKVASERYANLRRDCEKPDDLYIRNAILPCFIIPTVTDGRLVNFPTEDTKCNGCKRMLTHTCISNRLCEDCREVVRASRYRR